MSIPVIAFAALGGTIAMTPDADSASLRPRWNSTDLLATIPGVSTMLEARAVDLAGLPSASLTPTTIVEVVDWADQQITDGASGVVVSQGSDTLEETAYLASLYWSREEPLIFTAVMRGAREFPQMAPATSCPRLLSRCMPAREGEG